MAKKNSFLKETETLRDLRALEEIENNPGLSQRELASSLNVALGIANSCIHTLVRKGLVKIRGENNRSITYHLTKKGLIHKGLLAMEWTKNTIDFYRQARQQVALGLAFLAQERIKTIVLYKMSELTEIAVIVAVEAGVEIVGIIASKDTCPKDNFLGVPVGGLELLKGKRPDAVVVCRELNHNELHVLERELKNNEIKTKIYNLASKEDFKPSIAIDKDRAE